MSWKRIPVPLTMGRTRHDPGMRDREEVAVHEVSIAMDLLDIASKKCREAGYGRIDSIRLRVGSAAGVMPDALLFAFDAVKTGTIAGEASLQIDIVPLSGSCDGCGGDFVTEDAYVLECPLCGAAAFDIHGGYELEIVEMEVD